ncbi:hypothetical protein [Flavobacterium seoulense]|uniref:Uncharacterized protein n=1 Tax=Flavobacterium seoulense TaxID=1492738 RepID=A0A066WQ58_9FLAO|nr:hypothetical protein [Flavobacterium seoulense]KDN54708.1 hypothetical protein FEM21_22220 [Flavobacterium seoulense]
MKKIIFVAFVIISCKVFSQINSPNGNNIFYYNGLADVTFKFPERGVGGRAFVHYPNNILSINYASDFTGGTLIGDGVFFKDGGNSYIMSGNLGIGTTNPQWGLLQLNCTNDISTALRLDVGGFSMGGQAKFMIDAPGIGGGRFTVSESGNIGIGTPNPNNKLDVNGTIHSKEVKVDMTGWSDFVFNKEYSLPTLEEVEKHITEKGHLQNVPSEKEVLENGINLGEMNAKLLQKIEELTLYLIEQNKFMEKLKQEIEILKEQKK